MKKYAWTIGTALAGAGLAAIRAKWHILEILSGALWGAALGFLIGVVAETEEQVKGKK